MRIDTGHAYEGGVVGNPCEIPLSVTQAPFIDMAVAAAMPVTRIVR